MTYWIYQIYQQLTIIYNIYNIKYLFVTIDVFSRFASVVPMKNKVSKTIIDAMKESFNIMNGKPDIINCDNGSEFINNDFKKFVNYNNIDVRYVQVGDHHKLGIVDRFNRTPRDKINKLLTIKHTTRYIDSLVSIVYNYNDNITQVLKKLLVMLKIMILVLFYLTIKNILKH